MSKVLIIGAGISGCTAALELARGGCSVDVIERAPMVGGKILGYCCKATEECSRCGVCVAHTVVSEALAHPSIRFLTAARVMSIRSTEKKIHAEILQRLPSVNLHRDMAARASVDACPAGAVTQYRRGGVLQLGIDHAKCLRHQGKTCNRCVTASKSETISGRAKAATHNIAADALLVATGHEAYAAQGKPSLGYGRLDGVMTGEEAERILSTRHFLRKPAEDVAFVQCVGSRDPEIGRNYCSAVCCAYASRMARVLKHRNPEARVTVYYIDLQNFDKTFSEFRRKVESEGIRYVRSVPFSIDAGPGGKLKVRMEGNDGVESQAEHDTVVLSVGLGPAPDGELAELPGLARDAFGFLSSGASNLFTTGTCSEPQTIPESMASARSAASSILEAAPPTRRRTKSTLSRGERRVRLNQRVLVVGDGLAGAEAARRLHAYGHKTVLLNASPTAEDSVPDAVDVVQGASLTGIAGNVGAFTARVQTDKEQREVECGAIIVCTDPQPPKGTGIPLDDDRIAGISDLQALMRNAAPKNIPFRVALVMDLHIEETKAAMESAFHIALQLKANRRRDVHLYCREARVASKDLEALYDEVRQAGVDIVKYEGDLSFAAAEEGLRITAHDTLLGEDITEEVDFLAVSPSGISVSVDPELAHLLGVSTDAHGQWQDNNLHLFPERTNRVGIFVAGAGMGRPSPTDMRNDASAAAMRVHQLLSPRIMRVDPAHPVVDERKCVFCLTCIRSCPHGAMVQDDKRRVATCIGEACQHCGLCVGECPQLAISIPAEDGAA